MKKIFFIISILFLVVSSIYASPKHEFRATWFTTWAGDWQKIYAVDDAKMVQQQNALKACFDSLARCNVNAVCFQVRSRSDVFYKSSYEPWAKELTGELGKDPGYDPLAFAIDEAHKRGMELHAWVNPFRLSSATDSRKTEVDVNNLYKAPDGKQKLQWSWVIPYNNASFTGQIIDPGFPAAREYVVNVLMEIVNKYDIDGIVMDDYFYGYGGTADNQDQDSQSDHFDANEVEDENGDGKKLDDWRRSNVDAVIEAMYDSIQIVKPWVRFGMGPGGIWSTNDKVYNKYEIRKPQNIDGAADPYTLLYCNTVKWVKEGWVDYVNPQIYWSTTISKFNYKVLCEWWAKDVCEHFSNKLEGNQRVHFYPSQTADKAFTTDNSGTNVGFGTTDEEGIEEIIKQINTNRNHLSSGYTGSVFFKNSTFLKMSDMVASACYQQKALVPPMAWKSTETLEAPNTLRINGDTLTWAHASAERFTVYIYPKNVHVSQAIEEPYYFQGVVYGKSFTLPNTFNTTTHNIAVRTYDRYGVEHAPAEYGPDVTYVLNGGLVKYEEQVTVPTNAELWGKDTADTKGFMRYFNHTRGVKRASQEITAVTSFWVAGNDPNALTLTSDTSRYKWLGDYIKSVAGAPANELAWRANLHAFLNCSTAYKLSSVVAADFSEAGKPEKWGPYYLAAHTNMNIPKQPTQEELWAQFKEVAGITTLGTLAEITDAGEGKPHNDGNNQCACRIICNKLTDALAKEMLAKNEWTWLKTYILGVQTGLPEDLSGSAWKYAVAAFFLQSQHSAWPASADFSTAGQPSAWKDAWEKAHPATPADPEIREYTLPDFIVGTALTLPTEESRPVFISHPEEYEFAGWVDNAGNSIPSLSAGYKGTVYAQWNSPIKWVLNGGTYTGHHELPLAVDEEYTLPTVRNMRKEGNKFKGWYDNQACEGNALTTISASYSGTLYAKWGTAHPVVWHPNMDTGVRNEDLWEHFMSDYNKFYTSDILGENRSEEKRAYQVMTGAFGFMHSGEDNFKEGGRAKDFMEHEQSPWKWLGDYIIEVLDEENKSLQSNAPLWTSFKEATGLTHLGALKDMDFVKICGTGALDTDNKDGKTGGTILTALFALPEWEWLKGYIKDTQNAVKGTVLGKNDKGDDIKITELSDDFSARQWAFAVAAFFLQSQYTTWPASADFSTAGKHSEWKDDIPEAYHELGHFRITSDLEWRKTLHAFFNHTDTLRYTVNGTTKEEGTANFTVKGLPTPNGDLDAGWYNEWWNATFPAFVEDREQLPILNRNGYVFGGWYYGDATGYYRVPAKRADAGYNANEEHKDHIWARWLELCLYEGTVNADPYAMDENGNRIASLVNNNEELTALAAQEIAMTGLSRKIDVERTLVGGMYNTMFLPFGINGAGGTIKINTEDVKLSGKRYYLRQVVDDNGNQLLPPATTSILVYDSCKIVKEGGEDLLVFNFHEYAQTDSTETLYPNKPFLIKPENDVTERMHFWTALVNAPTNSEPAAIDANAQAIFQGTLAPIVLAQEANMNHLILVANERLAQVNTPSEMLGLRAYFRVPKSVPQGIRSVIRVSDEMTDVDNVPTDLPMVRKIMQNGKIFILRDGKLYDLMGRCLK